MYATRMNNYYPPLIQAIEEFRAIIDAEYPEFEMLGGKRTEVMNDFYFETMGESRIAQWETALGITPLVDSTVDDRRDVLIARLRGQGKLNTQLINSIVGAFTGGTANSWFEDNTLFVEITPPPDNKSYKFQNVQNELANKVPAHIRLVVTRNYYEWQEVYDNYTTWQDVYDNFPTWEEVYLNVQALWGLRR